MAESSTAPKSDEAVSSIDDLVRVRDLTNAHQNPNIPRSVFAGDVSDATIKDDDYVSYVDGSSKPGKDFAKKSVSLPARQMKFAFDANGETGGAGDWLVYFNNGWHVVKDADIK
jgi:hypothetical protein